MQPLYTRNRHIPPDESAFPVPLRQSINPTMCKQRSLSYSDLDPPYLNVGLDVSTQTLQLMGSNLHRHIIGTGRLALPYTQPHTDKPTNTSSAREPSSRRAQQTTEAGVPVASEANRNSMPLQIYNSSCSATGPTLPNSQGRMVLEATSRWNSSISVLPIAYRHRPQHSQVHKRGNVSGSIVWGGDATPPTNSTAKPLPPTAMP